MLLAYYSDDFTGSTDVLEALTTSGVETMLFTGPPDEEMLAQFPKVQAIGVAGTSRTMSPEQMDRSLPSAIESLLAHGPAIVHYKVCSTFDSSPQFGSIGRAIEIGRRVCGNRITPLVVGSPKLQRFCLFGNLFARSGLDSPAYRLDRHPTMSKHPVTPMSESDLRIHLSRQTSLPIELVDVLTLNRSEAAVPEVMQCDGSVVLFDTLTEEHLATIGQLLWDARQRENQPLFVAGSSGIESALAKHWRSIGILPSESKGFAAPRSVDHSVVVSGSCSPVTGRQIAWAVAHGFAEVPLDTAHLVQTDALDAAIADIAKRVASELAAGRSVIVHTSRGPDDERFLRYKQSVSSGLNGCRLGVILGRILGDVLRLRNVARVAVAGGDTASAVAREVGIDALEMVGPLAPGAPLCVVHSRRAEVDGVEFTFKGGQVGHDDFFGTLLRGGPGR